MPENHKIIHQDDLTILDVGSSALVKDEIKAGLDLWKKHLPGDSTSRILLKPNFNSNFNALTGNTTDLRVIAAVIEYLQSKGYGNIIIAEGTNSGFFREGISVIDRLKAHQLAKHYGVELADLNHWPESIDVPLENGIPVQVADLMVKADFVINMPKLKTHFEVGMSVCLKNLIGTCIGRENKKKIHGSLSRNIVRLNETIKPHLHIVDGLIGMEGNGPSRGTPVKYGKVIIGMNPYMIDYMCGRLVCFPRNEIKTLVAAQHMGHIGNRQIAEWESISLAGLERSFEKPVVTPWVGFVINPRFQKYLIKIRYAPVMNSICSTQIVKNIFYATGISQERIQSAEAELSLRLNKDLCDGCLKCELYCPIGLSLNEIAQGGGEHCLGCLYCYSVCPQEAIIIEGEMGFYAEQVRIYDDIIRRMA